MARQKTVKLTLIDGSTWFVPESEFISYDVPDNPHSVISSYIRGSRGPLLPVNSLETMDGEKNHINANYIISVKVTYDS
jgi:hypothetical protein